MSALPGTWYDLSGRIDAALAVAEAMPTHMDIHSKDKLLRMRIESLMGLNAALVDVLKLARADCDVLETTFDAPH